MKKVGGAPRSSASRSGTSARDGEPPPGGLPDTAARMRSVLAVHSLGGCGEWVFPHPPSPPEPYLRNLRDASLTTEPSPPHGGSARGRHACCSAQSASLRRS